MKNLTWQNPEQLSVDQVLINKVKSKCCGIKDKSKVSRILMDYIYFTSRDELIRIKVTDIAYFEGDGNYTKIVAINGSYTSICMQIGVMESSLAEQLGDNAFKFIRIGKRYIVNREYIYMINIPKQTLTLSDFDHFTTKLNVSREALKNLKALMTKNQE